MSITRVRYNKDTTVMTPKEERYWYHFLKGDPIIGDFIKKQAMLNPQMRRDVLNQPICPKCEKFAFHHKEGVQCPTCGHWEPTKTHKVKEHIKGGHYK